MMKTLIIFTAFTALASAVEWTDLRVRWNELDTEHIDSFFQIPQTAESAISNGWVILPDVNDHPVTIYCLPGDGRICIITDSYGNFAGLQVSLLASDVENKGIPYDPSIHAVFKRKTLFGEDYWTTTAYTVDPDVIDAGGRSDTEGQTLTSGIWIERGDTYQFVSKNVNTMQRSLDFRRKLCHPQMGTHFYFRMDPTLDCMEIQPFFLMYSGDDLTSLGFTGFGRPTTVNRNWYDAMDWTFIRLVNPDAPTCLTDWAEEYGLISIHFYFVPDPWNITC